MALEKSKLRKRAERGAGSRSRGDVAASSRPGSVFGDVVRRFLLGQGGRVGFEKGELSDEPLVDLLSPGTAPGPDAEALLNHLDLAFLGRASTGELDRELDAMPAGDSRWVDGHFAGDLFLADFVAACLRVRVAGQNLDFHRGFVGRVLRTPPCDRATVEYRQGILRELEDRPELKAATEQLLTTISGLLAMLRASRDDARLEPLRFRLDVLTAFRRAVNEMAEGFRSAESGLRRLHLEAVRLQKSRAFGRLAALLDHQSSMATLRLEVVLGADGRLRHLEVRGLTECKGNPFFRRPIRRWWDRLRIAYHRYNMGADELVDRLVASVYQEVAPALARVIQLLCHLEVYLAMCFFARNARLRGLQVCLPEVDRRIPLTMNGLFNPLLLAMMERPVPSDLEIGSASSISIVTGPNSGGKTRLLQAVGIAQVLAQSGFFAPCSGGRFPLVDGLFASIVEVDRADQDEGRLGTELVRLRNLFETAPEGAMVLLDELCSGTNPSEAVEIVETVIRLLQKIEPVAFVTTHFLDFAEKLRTDAAANGCVFLQAEVDAEHGATFRFVPGVARTSLAVGTAQRLGVTFEELERRLEQRRGE